MGGVPQTDNDPWEAGMGHAMQGIVNIYTARPFNFNDSRNSYTESTGFIVDTEIGLILTNRHIISEAPEQSRAIMQSGARQFRITPCYPDPIHDFTFCRFDVEDLHGLPIKAIELRPDLAKVGQEIRVLGNNVGQRMSILPGVISRVDCNPPWWDSCQQPCYCYHFSY